MRRFSKRPPRFGPCTVRLLKGENDLLLDIMLRLDEDRAEGHVVGIDRTAVVHGNGKKTGKAEGLAVGGNFLQMPAKRFFALVEAAADLESWDTVIWLGVPGVGQKCVERLVPISPLECQVKDSAAFQAGKCFDLF